MTDAEFIEWMQELEKRIIELEAKVAELESKKAQPEQPNNLSKFHEVFNARHR